MLNSFRRTLPPRAPEKLKYYDIRNEPLDVPIPAKRGQVQQQVPWSKTNQFSADRTRALGPSNQRVDLPANVQKLTKKRKKISRGKKGFKKSRN